MSQNPLSKLGLFFTSVIFSALCFLSSCQNQTNDNQQQIILWAWERPENLEFINPHKYGVAFLAQTLRISNGEIETASRRQPLKVSLETKLTSVTRIETPRTENNPQNYTDEIRQNLKKQILKTLENKNVSAIQIDFDAKVSERVFYRKLIEDIRQTLPKNIGFSITVLASFCIGDKWIDNLPVDYVVPMIFRMGADEKEIKEYLANGNDFQTDLCRKSYGISIDEPIKTVFKNHRIIYVFNVKSWTKDDLNYLDF